VNIFFEGSLIAKHLRSFKNFKYSTIHEHMPKNHQEYGSWNPERIGNWASSIGENTAELIQRVLKEKEHPALGYKACMGIIGFEKIELNFHENIRGAKYYQSEIKEENDDK
jgi:hypothetical protein